MPGAISPSTAFSLPVECHPLERVERYTQSNKTPCRGCYAVSKVTESKFGLSDGSCEVRAISPSPISSSRSLFIWGNET